MRVDILGRRLGTSEGVGGDVVTVAGRNDSNKLEMV